MKKKVITIASDDVKVKKIEKNIYKSHESNKSDNKYFNWLIYMIGYAVVLIVVSKLFESFEINTSNFGIYALLAAIIIYVLNKTVKPILKWLMMPITILSLGILYPLTNIIILYLTSFILGNNFNIKGFFSTFVVAITISLFNILMEGLIIKPIIKRNNGYHG